MNQSALRKVKIFHMPQLRPDTAKRNKTTPNKHPALLPSASYTQGRRLTLLKRWEQDENWGISVDDSSSLVSSSSEPRWR